MWKASRTPFATLAGTLRPREIDVVRLVVGGLTSKEIARKLRVSPLTIRKHRENAMRRLNVHSMAALIVAARTLGLTHTPSEPYRTTSS